MKTPQHHHLIIGDGPIGRGIAQTLQQLGHNHSLASRSGAGAALMPSSSHVKLDACNASAVLAATAHASHVYIALGLAYRTHIWQRDWPLVVANVLHAAKVHGFKLVFFDNIYAYASPLQNPMHEDHALGPCSKKGEVRAGVLRQLAQTQQQHVKLVIARCADFYGPGPTNSMLQMAVLARQQRGLVAQWLGNPDVLHSFTFVPDAAKATVRLALDDTAYGQSWHLPTAPACTPRELIAMSAQMLGAPAGVNMLPDFAIGILKWVVPMLREVSEMLYQNRQPYVFSSAKFMRHYPDFEITSLRNGLAQCANAMRK